MAPPRFFPGGIRAAGPGTLLTINSRAGAPYGPSQPDWAVPHGRTPWGPEPDSHCPNPVVTRATPAIPPVLAPAYFTPPKLPTDPTSATPLKEGQATGVYPPTATGPEPK